MVFLEYQADTIVNNLTLNKVNRQEFWTSWLLEEGVLDTIKYAPLLFYQEGNILYEYKEEELQKVYNFDLNVGDTLSYLSYSPYYNLVLDSIGQMEIDGHSFAFQRVWLTYELSPAHSGHIWMIEKLGDRGSFFIPNYTVLAIPDGTAYDFRCYEDDTGVAINLSSWGHECDYIPGLITTIDDATFDNLKIFPNPTADIIRVQLDAFKIIQLKVFSVTGQQLLSQNTDNEIVVNVDLSTLNKGFYYLVGYGEDGNIISMNKVIKN